MKHMEYYVVSIALLVNTCVISLLSYYIYLKLESEHGNFVNLVRKFQILEMKVNKILRWILKKQKDAKNT
jgi:hypothetical protein